MPMCMIYGKEDPWVVPFWGQRAKQRNPDAVYYELSPAGHCPHHEAPEVLFPAYFVLKLLIILQSCRYYRVSLDSAAMTVYFPGNPFLTECALARS